MIDVQEFTGPEQVHPFLDTMARIQPVHMPAMAAMDMAVHDLAGKLTGRTAGSLFGLEGPVSAPTSYTLSMAEEDRLEEALKEAAPYGMLKVKAGGAHDLEWIGRVQALSRKPVCVDANQGWKDRDRTLEWIYRLKEQGAVFIEQPFEKDRFEDARWLKERSPLPVIADESFQGMGDWDRVADAFHGVNVKLMKCGGMRAAVRVMREARASGMKILLGCMSESSCGVAAAAQLAPLADWVDLDGPLLIDNDPFGGLRYAGGVLHTSGQPGLGIYRKR